MNLSRMILKSDNLLERVIFGFFLVGSGGSTLDRQTCVVWSLPAHCCHSFGNSNLSQNISAW